MKIATWTAATQHVGYQPAQCRVFDHHRRAGKWAEITVSIDPIYLSVLVSAEKKFWRCVQFGQVPSY
jgi:hypothetical protein